MRAWVIIVVLVVIGVFGAWVGYWVGHALGWSTNAEFPLRIGAGERAIGLSILLSFGCVMAGAGWLIARPLWRIRKLLASGNPGQATIRKVWRTGYSRTPRGGARERWLAFELEVHPDGGGDYVARANGLLTEAQEAALEPGADVTVRVDPSNPSSVVVVGPSDGTLNTGSMAST